MPWTVDSNFSDMASQKGEQNKTVEKFDGENLQLSNIKMKMLLLVTDLQNIANGTRLKPLHVESATKWESSNAKALDTIWLELKDTQLMHASSVNSRVKLQLLYFIIMGIYLQGLSLPI
ncbi:hypothetical protein SUGI_0605710 [Cryptomeria japonica]|nr:hypothetical protein SUGI_0605710 [Cryptomeria japonica]